MIGRQGSMHRVSFLTGACYRDRGHNLYNFTCNTPTVLLGQKQGWVLATAKACWSGRQAQGWMCEVLTEPGICHGNQDSCGNENRKSRKNIFSIEKKSTSILFSMKIKMMDLWMQIEGINLVFVMNFSVLHFFKSASRMPQIAQILVSTFKFFGGGWVGGGGGRGGRGGGHMPLTPPPPLEISSFFSFFFFY